MAYVNQERKAKLAAKVKEVIPAGWKYSLAVRNHSTIVLTISAAPVDLLAEYARVANAKYASSGDTGLRYEEPPSYHQVNEYHLETQFDESLPVFEAIKIALNDGNHDRSDSQTDYFDVGWYVNINLGRWDKPFVYVAPAESPAVGAA